jgi:hypothetical protein
MTYRTPHPPACNPPFFFTLTLATIAITTAMASSSFPPISCVPVKRAQDGAKKCDGQLLGFSEAKATKGTKLTVKGKNTVFTTQVS